ncbi:MULTISPECIES: hypothetical protein [Acidithrix]|uniref:Cell division protein FtsL n=1 Tax=Acidithrix ferrooxidans TaxID=1280514 RepID=A0A0D8HM99_9ACTN|nr:MULTISPECIES: hypothetical protein [Acidithrix]KJF19038.1 cell division protein FtsL [Acidithrix ferrooxidans]CAG4901131.1 unnamed protein product [Acidithrix sp. C25]
MSQIEHLDDFESARLSSFEEWLSGRSFRESPSLTRTATDQVPLVHGLPTVPKESSTEGSPSHLRTSSGGGRARRTRFSGVAINAPIERVDSPPTPQPLTHAPRHLKSLPTGKTFRNSRRNVLLRRVYLGIAIVVLFGGIFVSVMARAEIAKMQLEVNTIAPEIASLTTTNNELALRSEALSAPARIAQYAQTKLHMVFSSGPGTTSTYTNSSGISPTSTPLSLYYTPGGSAPVTTNVSGSKVVKTAAPSSASSSATAATQVASGSSSSSVSASSSASATTQPSAASTTTTSAPIRTITMQSSKTARNGG